MQLSTTDRYLYLLREALEGVIAPELQSSHAKLTLDAMRSVIDELRKRENGFPPLLQSRLEDGRAIADRMRTVISQSGGDVGSSRSSTWPQNSDYHSLRDAHDTLTRELSILADALVALRSRAADAGAEPAISDLLCRVAEWERGYYADAATLIPPALEAPQRAQVGAPLTRQSLEAFLRGEHPDRDRCSLTQFEPVPGGFSKQTFRIGVRDARGEVRPLIVRKNAPVQAMAYGGFLIENEFHLLRAVYATGLPVAEPLFLGKDVPGVDADFYVMSALPGKLYGSYLGGAAQGIPETVMLEMAALLAQLHGFKPERFASYLNRYAGPDPAAHSVEACYRREIAAARAYHAEEKFLPSPYLSYLFDWLEEHIPRISDPARLVHGDFNIHNLLAEDERITGILDWECANFGAAEQDLAWIKPHISQHIDWDRFVAHYQASGGAAIDADTLRFCTAFNAMRTSLAANKQMYNVQNGIEPSIKMAMIELGFALAHMRIV